MSEKTCPLIFGEVLFDCFPDGSAVLGGAPFNVAWHLQGFGLDPYFISRVGQDTHGERIVQAMRNWGMEDEGVRGDPEHPTGTVTIHWNESGHSFEILAEQAYDYITPADVQHVLDNRRFALFYHGSLIRRGAVSRSALEQLQGSGLPAFVDVNLRTPWWEAESIDEILGHARWLKINDEELALLGTPLGFAGDNLEQQTQRLQAKYPQIERVIVTRGAQGAFLRDAVQGRSFEVRPDSKVNVVDTVGAGDAFAAVSIAGIMSGWPAQELLSRAQRFAEAVCEIRGATSDAPTLYAEHRIV